MNDKREIEIWKKAYELEKEMLNLLFELLKIRDCKIGDIICDNESKNYR